MRFLVSLTIVALGVAGCEQAATPQAPAADAGAAPTTQSSPAPTGTVSDAQPDRQRVVARAHLVPTTGHDASGRITIEAIADGIRIHGEISGLEPGSRHGFHVHEHGDCSAGDASSAGGHFSPAGNPHGDPASDTHHAGDLPNLVANDQGVAEVDLRVGYLALGTGDARDVVGQAFILHAEADDFTTQPAGDAGERVACGVIESIESGGDAVASS